LTDADLVGANSLDGWIGYHLNSEFTYKILARPRFVCAYKEGTEEQYFYEFQLSYNIPKNQKKFFRSTEQETDTPTIRKMLAVVISKADLVAGALSYEISGTMELRYNKRTMTFADWSGPAL
jgi:hypothetical protein